MSSQERAQEQKELGNSALKEHRYKDAIKFYSLALDINPDNTAALFNKTIAYIKMDDWENAVVDKPQENRSLLQQDCHLDHPLR